MAAAPVAAGAFSLSPGSRVCGLRVLIVAPLFDMLMLVFRVSREGALEFPRAISIQKEWIKVLILSDKQQRMVT